MSKAPVRLAGVALVIAGAAYAGLLVILAVVSHGRLPASGQELLDYVAARGALIQVAMAVFIVKDACILVAFPILASLLGGLFRPSLWLATVLASIGMLLDILSGLIVIAFRAFANSYATASGIERHAYLPTAALIFQYVWRVETPLIVALLSFAVMMFSRSMDADRFGRAIPWYGVVAGATGIVGATLGLIQPVLLLTLWYVAVGVKLVRCNSLEALRR